MSELLRILFTEKLLLIERAKIVHVLRKARGMGGFFLRGRIFSGIRAENSPAEPVIATGTMVDGNSAIAPRAAPQDAPERLRARGAQHKKKEGGKVAALFFHHGGAHKNSRNLR
jgi:hypothetical protein